MYVNNYKDLTVIKMNNNEYGKAFKSLPKNIKYFSAYCTGEITEEPVFDYESFYKKFEDDNSKLLEEDRMWYEHKLRSKLQEEINKVIEEVDNGNYSKDLSKLKYSISYK